ncbi:MAG: EamA family transporter [Thermoplasmatales archaeon B_DKE]|nr:MAG: EamA family transporter [Thermoplasmatales archaeon B_DKE]
MKAIWLIIPYVVFTSFSYYFAKDGLYFVSPFLFMGLRYLIAGLILLAISRKLILTRTLVYLSIMTATSTMFWAFGLMYVSPAESAVLSYSMPLFSLPIAFFMVREEPSHMEIVGITIGFAGIIVYGLPLIHGFTAMGVILTVVNAFFWAMFTVFYRKLSTKDPMSVNASQFLIGAAIMLALSPFYLRADITASFAVDLIWMATLGGAAQFLIWNFMLRESRVNKITVLAFSVPIFTMILGAFMAMAVPDVFSISGVALMFTGIILSRVRGGISFIKRSDDNVEH